MTSFVSNFSEWPGEGKIFPVEAFDLDVLAEPHPYHLAERDAAARNWQQEIAANPALFDGQVILQRAVSIENGVISGSAHIVPFSTFLWWRKTRPQDAAVHLFSLPVIMSGDGAVIAIRMGAHTANPGRVYCAAGSLDPGDIVDGKCDLAGNMAREVREETGLDLSEAAADPGYQALHAEGVVTLFRCYRFSDPADVLVDRIAKHIAADSDPEIDQALAVRSPDPALHPYPAFMIPILAHVLEKEEK